MLCRCLSVWQQYINGVTYYRYIVDCITKEEAVELLRKNVPYKNERQDSIKLDGYPAYTTAVS